MGKGKVELKDEDMLFSLCRTLFCGRREQRHGLSGISGAPQLSAALGKEGLARLSG